MNLVIAATPAVAIPTIKHLQLNHRVTIVTAPDSPAGRGKNLRASEIAETFADVHKPENETELKKILKGSDLLITIGYGRLLSEEILQTPEYGGINLHFSLLPRWRGAAPVQRAIANGDKVTGVTVFQMDKGMDTGPIWSQLQFEIPYGFSSPELFQSLSHLGVNAIDEALIKILNGGTPIAQHGEVTIAKKVSKEECSINWKSDAQSIVRQIKAFAFNPGVTTSIRNTSIKIIDARVSEATLQIGELSKNGEVGTGQGSIQLLIVTPAGKRAMPVLDWLNGFKVQTGERFE